mmetsp:Transcript_16719/g.31675  ORF Transcript_16719/g.31675 Transcript_16719/m.31675 type:complete len:422 (-) Transcript_16719:833-2098(-)
MQKFDQLVGLFLSIALVSGLINISLYFLLDRDAPDITQHHIFDIAASHLRKFYLFDSEYLSNNHTLSNTLYHHDGGSSNQENHQNHDDDKQPILKILQESGVIVTPDIVEQLPTWSQVTSLYGDSPHIVGLEQCPEFQSRIPKNDAYIGPSGLFNTGTNLLADLLEEYCILPDRTYSSNTATVTHLRGKTKPSKRMNSGMLWQVPWGKHNPISWRTHHMAIVGSEGVEQTHVLPVAVIKDPFHWMESMCRHSYAAHWFHDPQQHCPNLVPNHVDIGHRGIDKESKTVPVNVAYQSDRVSHYDSLIGVWNEWYGDYLKVDEFPRLMIRFEDILFHLDKVITQVCHCGGGKLINHENGIHLKSESVKKGGSHQGSSGLLSAIIRYGSDKHRLDGMTKEDIEYATSNVNADLMKSFGYNYPDHR